MRFNRARLSSFITAAVLAALSSPALAAEIPVTWNNKAGVSVVGTTLVKTAAERWGNSGAASYLARPGNLTLEFVAGENDTFRMIGLSASDDDASWGSIEFAFYLRADGLVQVYESGSLKGTFGVYSQGDSFQIERSGTTITYKRDGLATYTSATPTSDRLLADVALYSTGATVVDARITGVPAEAPAPVPDILAEVDDGIVDLSWGTPSNSGSPITGYTLHYWSLEEAKLQVLSVDASTNDVIVPGLTNGEAYGFQVLAVNAIGTGLQGDPILLAPNDKSPVDWDDEAGMEASDNLLRKTVGNGWGNAGPGSRLIIPLGQSGGVEFLATETTSFRMAGLSVLNSDANWPTLGHAIYLLGDRTFAVYESGAGQGYHGNYATGDLFSVERIGEEIHYRRNGATFFVSTEPSNADLLIDTAFYSHNATLADVKILGGAESSSDQTMIGYGQSVQGRISPGDESDEFAFEGTAGDEIAVASIGQRNSHLIPYVELFREIVGSDGVIWEPVKAGRRDLEATLDQDGLYILVISRNSSSRYAFGTYSFTLQRRNDALGAKPIYRGELVKGLLAPAADIDFYRFHARANESVVIPFARDDRNTLNFNLIVELYDEFGILIDRASSGNIGAGGELNVVVPEEGTYHLEVFERERDQIGAYHLELRDSQISP